MAADLHIHIRTQECTEDVLNAFRKNTIGHPRGHVWDDNISDEDNIKKMQEISGKYTNDDWRKAYNIISDTPNIWIGRVSWLKAGLLGDDGREYIPEPVEIISDLLENEPVITEELISKITNALSVKSTANEYYTITDDIVSVRQLLQENIGKQAFTVSW